MKTRKLGNADLQIAPLVLGGNVFGWTADEATTFEVLDAFLDGGLNAIDTADVYSTWVPGNKGGESESLIGAWLKRHPGHRQRVVLITKVGSPMAPGREGLSPRWITQAVEDSLRRLQTDHIDLYLAHRPDPQTPHQETLEAFEKLKKAGKIRAFGASNYDARQLEDSFVAARSRSVGRYEVLQPEYNLYTRSTFDGALRDLTTKEGLGVIPYYSLASGFLSGKYRSEADFGKSARGGGMAKYLNPKGLAILKALDRVSGEVGATPAEVALAWLIAQPGITAPIASATSRAQVGSLRRATEIDLSPAQMVLLDQAGQGVN